MTGKTTNMQCDVVYDNSGTLVTDVMYEFGVQYDDILIADDRDASWTVVSLFESGQLEEGCLWVQLLNSRTDYRYECLKSQQHVTRTFYDKAAVTADLCGGNQISEFIPDGMENEVIISDSFQSRLSETGLTGMRFLPIVVNVNQSDTKRTGDPQLYILEFSGTIWGRPLSVLGNQNACPFCGFNTLVCSGCGHYYTMCPTCHKQTMCLWSTHPGGDDKRLKSADVPKAGLILQGKTWDGKDFSQGTAGSFITKRALSWLLCVHAKPFYVRPARVLVDGMSAEQRQWLKRAQEPVVNGMM